MFKWYDRHLLMAKEELYFKEKINKDEIKAMIARIMGESGYDLKTKSPKSKIKGITKCPVCGCRVDYFIFPNKEIHFHCTTKGCYINW